MRRITAVETVNQFDWARAPEDRQFNCDELASQAARHTLAHLVREAVMETSVKIGQHGVRRAYTAALVVCTDESFRLAINDATGAGQRYGERIGTMQGLDVGRLEGHRSGKHAAEADFRRLPLWRKVYHHFAGF